MRRASTKEIGEARASARGFTLIEMVVAVALIALIAVSLIESLRFGQRAYAAVVRSGGDAWDVFASQRLIRNLVESIYPVEAHSELHPRFGFVGDTRRIEFLALAPLAAGGAGLYRYEFSMREAGGQRDLVARWQPELESASVTHSGRALAEEVIVSDIASAEWAFLDTVQDTVAGDPQWQSAWQGRQRQPALVRLRVTFASGDARRWPELIVAPRITDDANCSFDVVAQRCRSAL